MANPIPHQTEEVTVHDGSIPLVTRRGRIDNGPALVVVPSVFGITDDLVEQMEAMADDAAIVVAVDLFWRTDPGPLPYGEMDAVMARLGKLDFEQAYEDYKAVVAWTRSRPNVNGRCAGLGICFGGPFTFLGAADGLLDAAVTWHGSRMHNFLHRAGDIRVPFVLHFGDADRVAPMDTVEQIREAFASNPQVEIVVHPGADHGFAQPGAPTYQPDAAAAATNAVHSVLRRLTGRR